MNATRLRIDPALLGMLALALLLRLVVAPLGHHGYDMDAFSEWLIALHTHPLNNFYDLPHDVPPDHLPGTLWILYALGHLFEWIEGGPATSPRDLHPYVKAIPIAADLINGALLWQIGRHFGGSRVGGIVAASYLFNPGIVFVSAFWGQWDSVSVACLLASLYLAVRTKIVFALPMLALGALLKPQLLLLAPLIVVFGIGRAIRTDDRTWSAPDGWHGVWKLASPVALGGFLATLIVTVAGWPFRVTLLPLGGDWTYLARVRFAAERYDGTTFGALGIWLAPIGTGPPPSDSETIGGLVTYAQLGYALAGATLIVAFAILRRSNWSAAGLVASSAAAYWGFCMFATRLHERYLLPAVVLLLLCAAVSSKFRMPAIALSAVFFVNSYLAFTFHDGGVPLAGWRTSFVLSVLAIAAVCLYLTFLHQTRFWPKRDSVRRPTLTDTRSTVTLTKEESSGEAGTR